MNKLGNLQRCPSDKHCTLGGQMASDEQVKAFLNSVGLLDEQYFDYGRVDFYSNRVGAQIGDDPNKIVNLVNFLKPNKKFFALYMKLFFLNDEDPRSAPDSHANTLIFDMRSGFTAGEKHYDGIVERFEPYGNLLVDNEEINNFIAQYIAGPLNLFFIFEGTTIQQTETSSICVPVSLKYAELRKSSGSLTGTVDANIYGQYMQHLKELKQHLIGQICPNQFGGYKEKYLEMKKKYEKLKKTH